MKKIFIAGVLGLFPMLALAKGIGYGNTQWGMNPNQVVVAEKGKAQIIEPKEFTGGLGKVRAENVKIDGHTYTATYVFDESNQLVATYLISNEKSNAGIANLEFNSLDKLLTQKYGKPQFKNENTVTWKTSSTTIELKKIIINSISYASATVSYVPNSKIENDVSNL
ncbi:hypothetical protein [Acinetobacter haemolyticus]|uniref:hypothetical protein n=1 Tax=Acinetobacter haemolyticus TaxID=29430 RepID=UPI001331CB9C|nr:hypothetical protein [Acinetobacter haemolyticus]QHI16252.1 hypothetical protein AhaeAN4_06425 [Acinetobacter haemolyticus]